MRLRSDAFGFSGQMDDAYQLQDEACAAFSGEKPSLCAQKELKTVDGKLLKQKHEGAFTVCNKANGEAGVV